MATKLGKDIEVGDIITVLGHTHRITKIRPYEGPLAHLWNGEARTARAADGWGITLGPDDEHEIG
jgi:hypothetical protein